MAALQCRQLLSGTSSIGAGFRNGRGWHCRRRLWCSGVWAPHAAYKLCEALVYTATPSIHQVTLTDVPAMLPLLTSNASANASLVAAAGGVLDVQEFDWAHPPDALCQLPWDVILGADLVYNQAGVAALCTAVQALLRGQQACTDGGRALTVLLAHKQRHEEVDWELLHGLQSLGVTLTAVATGEGSRGSRVTVYSWQATQSAS